MTPPFEALDEFHHYPFVKWLADGRGLPVLGPDASDSMYRQEGGQPPLYYALAALETFWIDTGDIKALYEPNPHATAGYPTASDNKNMVLHGSDETFPGEGKFLALHLVRLLSTLLGLVTVVATYGLARAASGGDELVAAGAAALVAFNPMFLFVAGSVNNDNLVNALASVTLLLLTLMILGRRSNLLLCLLGLLVGAAALSKLSGLALLPLSLIALGLCYWRERSWRSFAKASAIVTGISAAVAGWWYLRNWLLYGDPLGLNAFLSVVGGRGASFAQLFGEIEGFKLSFWGVFGGFNILMGRPVYLVYDILSVLAAAGLLYLAVTRARRSLACDRRLIAMHVIWIGAVSVALTRWTSMTLASQGRLVFPALSSLALLFALGLYSHGPRGLRTLGVAAVSLAFAGIAVAVPFLSITAAYPTAPLVTAQDALEFTHPLDINYEGKMALLGYDLIPAEVHPGGAATITLYWQVLAPMDKDYSLFIHVFGRDGSAIGQRDSYPGAGTYPTSSAKPGDYLRDRYTFRLAPDIVDSTAAKIEVGMYELSNSVQLAARDRNGHDLGSSPVVGRLKVAVAARTQTTSDDVMPVEGGVSNDVALLGYRLESKDIVAGGSVRGRLHWKALSKPGTDYTAFVQLVGPGGLLAQYDSQPQGGYYPTSFWDAGEVVWDDFEVLVPPGAKAGRYGLIAGMYDLKTGARVLFGGQDRIGLGNIDVGGRPSN